MNSRERNDLIISWATISLAFAFILSDGFFDLFNFSIALLVSIIGVGTGFVLHELAHKYVAIRFGAQAEFRAWKIGLILALVLPIITFGRFLFAAPGAVYIFGERISVKQNGLISIAGPLTNIVVAFVFLSLLLLFETSQLLNTIAVSGAKINFFLAFFNMIPFGPLDGTKVFSWNKAVWAIVFFFSFFAVFFLF